MLSTRYENQIWINIDTLDGCIISNFRNCIPIPVAFVFAEDGDDGGGDGGGDDGGGSDGGGDDKKDSGSEDKDEGSSPSEESNENEDTGDSNKEHFSEKITEGSDNDEDSNTIHEQNTASQIQGNDNSAALSGDKDNNNDLPGDAIIKSTPPTEEEEKEKAESDVQQQDSADINDKASDEPTQDEIDKEKAAIEDYIYDEPGKVKPYSTEGVKEPWKIKLIESLNAEAEQQNKPQEQEKQQRHRTEETEQQGNDPCNYFGKNICEGSKDGKTCNEEKFDCLSDTKDKDGNWNYCTTGKCPGDDKPYDKPPHGPEYCHNCGDDGKGKGKGDKGKDWWNQEGKHEHDYDDGHDHHDHNHHHHSNYCDYHNCHEHHHHSSTHFSDSHEGDVTVKIDLKYDEKDSDNLDDMFLFIGEDYDKNVDLSDKPDTIKVNHLDIDGGDTFAVCLANEDSQNGDCTVEEADNDHDTVNAFLTVK